MATKQQGCIAWLVVWRLLLRHIPACRELAAMFLPQAIAPSPGAATRVPSSGSPSPSTTTTTRRASTGIGATDAVQAARMTVPLTASSRASTNSSAGSPPPSYRIDRSPSSTGRASPSTDRTGSEGRPQSRQPTDQLSGGRHRRRHELDIQEDYL
ncbi:hypothetical protein SYNPS1DRAFT_29593 [Syncephalis pseudoplumigaleata]|uniref:Secreted protein n=1 Tax=Syncephalis pseudoplumigaleata TaxID=1712513 RepID=A0A4V1J1D2_9FUNG|nr:hypothetical protein SYNPS1DRAFT_29593 [Syncephalis pseudoplumigaleata]|eukprot:RKP24649.1 hypothetical protein SYNPS1DRAFT_29593 [Syncephalis pseudoplumigaleata]